MNVRSKSSGPDARPTTGIRWLKRLGFAGFAFFLIKGLMWLLVPWLAHSALF
jgi:hypothetical protein